MSKACVRGLMLTAVMLGGIAPTYAQTMQDTLTSAYWNNPGFQSERTAVDIADEQVAFARGARKPNVTISGGVNAQTQSSDRGFGLDLGETLLLQGQIEATYPIYTGGRLDAGLKQAELGRDASVFGFDFALQSLLLNALQAHIDVRLSAEELRIRQINSNRLKQQRDAAQERFDVGVVTRTDVAQAEARYQAAEAGAAQAEAGLIRAKAVYQQVVGAAANMPAPPPAAPGLPATLDEAFEIALSNNPQLKQAEKGVDAAKQALLAARGVLKPEIALRATGGFQDGHWENQFRDSNAIVGVQGSLPIYRGGQLKSDIRRAALEVERSKLTVDSARNQVVANVSQSWANLKASKESVRASQLEIRASEVALEGAEIELEVGLRTTLDLLDQEQELLEAQLRLVQTRRNEYLAAHQLLFSMGKMTPETLGVNLPLSNPENYRTVK